MNNKNTKLTEVIEKTGDLIWVLVVFFTLTLLFSVIWGEFIDILLKNDKNNQVIHNSLEQSE